MNRLFKTQIILISASIALTLISFSAMAALPEPWDPQEAVRWSVQERLSRLRALSAQLKKASPEQRQAYKESLRHKLAQLSVQERKALHDQLHAQWKVLSSEEKKQLRQERRKLHKALDPS